MVKIRIGYTLPSQEAIDSCNNRAPFCRKNTSLFFRLFLGKQPTVQNKIASIKSRKGKISFFMEKKKNNHCGYEKS